ncbi:response regulator transcription factor [Sporosarcina sp. FSL K6-3457]|uniref:response regulator transcription factor n=1 Tax=Sporosarcina sp. FSL K6-3457 TaxID=2978204 RepID=UPI0030F8A2EA
MIKMVIVDDEWLIRESLQHGIDWAAMGIEVVGTAADGYEAITLIKTEAPHLLVTDIRMPGLDGLELIGAAKDMNPDLKSIIISGFGEFEYAQKALKMGADDYLLKPIADEDLKDIINRLVCQVKLEEQDKQEKVDSYLLKVIRGELKADKKLFEQYGLNGQFGVICWDSEHGGSLQVQESGIKSLAQGILFVEEAHQKQLFFQQLDGLFIDNKVVGGCSSFSSNCDDLHSLYRQALMLKEQSKFGRDQGCLFYEHSQSPINMEEVFLYIEEHYQEAISLQSLATKFFISDSYFSRIFKQHTGKNFIEYVTEYRMKIAKDLLAYSTMKTNEVSIAVGYTDQRYFSQLFKKQIGMTPSLYRKKAKEEKLIP